MFQTYLNPQLTYENISYFTYEKTIKTLLNDNYKNNYLQLLKIIPVLTAIDYHTFYVNNHQLIFQQPSIPHSFQFSYFNKTHKKKLWNQISNQKFPENTYCKNLKISHSQLTNEELIQILKNPFYAKFLQNLDLISNPSLKPESLISLDIHLKNCIQLSLKNNLNIINLKNFEKLTNFSNMIHLNLENTNLDNDCLRILPEKFPKLTYLNISKNHNLDDFVALNELQGLKKLILAFTNLNILDIQGLIEKEESKLEYLDISNCKLGDFQERLGKLKENYNIKVLVLQDLKLNEQNLQTVFEKFVGLEKLDLEKNTSLARSSLEGLVIPQHSQEKIQWISLKECSFDENEQHRKDEKDRKMEMEQANQEYTPFDYGFIPFQVGLINNLVLKLRNLEFLDISYNKLQDHHLKTLIQGLKDHKIKHLELGNTEITVECADLFVNNEIFEGLESLGLRENNLTDQFIEVLKNDTVIKNLGYLNLSACKTSEQGFIGLLEWKGIQNLRDFRFSENVSRSNSEQYLEILNNNIETFSKIQRITIGSGLQNLEEIPEKISKRNITIAPFFGDGLD